LRSDIFWAGFRGGGARDNDTPLNVHLMTRTDVGLWIRRGGRLQLAIHSSFCANVRGVFGIENQGAMPVLVVPLDMAIEERSIPWASFKESFSWERIGIKGVDMTRIPERIRTLGGFHAPSVSILKFSWMAAFAPRLRRCLLRRAPVGLCQDRSFQGARSRRSRRLDPLIGRHDEL
jgi:hypothetical protein